MRKICLLLLTLASITTILCACRNTNTVIDSENLTESIKTTTVNKNTTISTTTPELHKTKTSTTISETVNKTETNTEIAETESDSALAAEIPVTEDNTETNTESVVNCQLNLDLLSDIGFTYDEIADKRGNRIGVFSEGGGFSYLFENGYGAYGWPISAIYEEGNWPRDGNGNFIKIEDLPQPNAEKKCGIIENIKTENLFLGITKVMTVSKIEEIYGIKYINTDDGCIDGNYNYASFFSFNNIIIGIYTKDKDKIDLDSYVFVKI